MKNYRSERPDHVTHLVVRSSFLVPGEPEDCMPLLKRRAMSHHLCDRNLHGLEGAQVPAHRPSVPQFS